MDDTSLITEILSCRRVVHDEPGKKPEVRIRIECETETGPLTLVATHVAANHLAAHLRHLRDEDEKSPKSS